jgi:hypothetical protein
LKAVQFLNEPVLLENAVDRRWIAARAAFNAAVVQQPAISAARSGFVERWERAALLSASVAAVGWHRLSAAFRRMIED